MIGRKRKGLYDEESKSTPAKQIPHRINLTSDQWGVKRRYDEDGGDAYGACCDGAGRV